MIKKNLLSFTSIQAQTNKFNFSNIRKCIFYNKIALFAIPETESQLECTNRMFENFNTSQSLKDIASINQSMLLLLASNAKGLTSINEDIRQKKTG